GLVRCGNCGSIMRPRVNSNMRRNPDSTQSFVYMCEFKERSRKSKCEMCNVNGNVLDKLVCDEILKFNRPDSVVGKQLDTLIKKSSKSTEDTRERLSELNKSVDTKQQMITNLMQALAKSEDSSAMLDYTTREVERLDKEIKQLQNEIAELSFLESEDTQRGAQIDSMIKSIGIFKERFEELSVVEKRDFMHELIDRIVWDGESAHIFLKHAGEQ
ncbi:MAG: recombinase zinc beta ribbon domain-containing protein, partial [Oscillospiraceae bacterium]